MAGPTLPSTAACADCQSALGAHQIRNRPLCSTCFIKYVRSKILKRMESYRFKNSDPSSPSTPKRKLLLPTSSGVSSLVLLHVLDDQLSKQLASRNRTAYDLIITHVDTSATTTAEPWPPWYAGLRDQYRTHNFLPATSLTDILTLDPTFATSMSALHLSLQSHPFEPAGEYITRLLTSPRTVTTSTTLLTTLVSRLLTATALQQNCTSILYGHSDTRLAALALASVAKGRGGSLPADIGDGPSSSTPGLTFNYPLRDLFKTELELYASLQPEDFGSLRPERPAEVRSIRNTSIDDLLTAYITSQGEKYPSIMANVVRTVSKLQMPQIQIRDGQCAVCRTGLTGTEDEKLQELCYACQRTKGDLRVPDI